MSRVQLWSCGGGRQSAGIAALICQERLPRPDHVVMVALEWERRATWDYVCGYIRPAIRAMGIPFTIVPRKKYATFLSVSKHAAILFKKGIPEEVHIEDVMQVNGQWYVAGTSGVVLVVCGVGQTMRQAQAQAYSRIRNIMIPDMYYRDDIGERWFEDHDKLHTWGYLREI